MTDFIADFKNFIFSLYGDWVVSRKGELYVYQREGLKVVAVPLLFFQRDTNETQEIEQLSNSGGDIFVYEDRWRHSNSLIKSHIEVNCGFGNRVFARNCTARTISSIEASDFLKVNHIYSSAKAKYNYGLFRNRTTSVAETKGEVGELLAVASFSEPRKIVRDGCQVDSYEWVRYASLTNVRIVGGMGKLLNYFIKEIDPQDIMSYSDNEWSDGSVYKTIGFTKIDSRKPVNFLVDLSTMERISEDKIGRDRKYIGTIVDGNYIRIFNLGSDKYYLKP